MKDVLKELERRREAARMGGGEARICLLYTSDAADE